MVYGVADPGVFAHDFIQRRLRAFYSGFVFGTAFARRASFTAATATAIKTLRSTPPYITKTIQGLPDSTFRSPPEPLPHSRGSVRSRERQRPGPQIDRA